MSSGLITKTHHLEGDSEGCGNDKLSTSPKHELDTGRKFECFFNEETFLRVMGPDPPFKERLCLIALRPKSQDVKQKIKLDPEILRPFMNKAESKKQSVDIVDQIKENPSMRSDQNKNDHSAITDFISGIDTERGSPISNEIQETNVKHKDIWQNSMTSKVEHNTKSNNELSRTSSAIEIDGLQDSSSNISQTKSIEIETNDLINDSKKLSNRYLLTETVKSQKIECNALNDISTVAKVMNSSTHVSIVQTESKEIDNNSETCVFLGNMDEELKSTNNLNFSIIESIENEISDSDENSKYNDLLILSARDKLPLSDFSTIESPSKDGVHTSLPECVEINTKIITTPEKAAKTVVSPFTKTRTQSSGENKVEEEEDFCLVLPNPSDEESSDEDLSHFHAFEKKLEDQPPSSENDKLNQESKKTEDDRFAETSCDFRPSSVLNEQSPFLKVSSNCTTEPSTSLKSLINDETTIYGSKSETLTSIVKSPTTVQVNDIKSNVTSPFDTLNLTSINEIKAKHPMPTDMRQDNNKNDINILSLSQAITSIVVTSHMPNQVKLLPPRIWKGKRSKLSKKQHKRYVQLHKRFFCPKMQNKRKTGYSEEELREIAELEELQGQVSFEQAEYQIYLKDKAEIYYNAYNYLPTFSRHYTQARYSKYRHMRNHYKNFDFQPIQEIPLVIEDKNASCLMVFKKTLLKLGNSPRITLPVVKEPAPINVEESTLNDYFPINDRNMATTSVDHKMVSEDVNAIQLAEEEEVDMVLSSSSFKCLLDNHGCNLMKAWDIPISIRSLVSEGRRHKTIYFDKPLPRDDVLVRDFNTMYHKYLLRTFISRPRGLAINRIQANQSLRPRKPTIDDSGFASNTFDLFSTGTADIETFGSFTSNTTTKRFSGEKHCMDTSTSDLTKEIIKKGISGGECEGSKSTLPPNDSVVTSEALANSSPCEKAKDVETFNPRRSTRLSECLMSKPPNLTVDSCEPPVKTFKFNNNKQESTVFDCEGTPKRKRGRPRKDSNLNVSELSSVSLQNASLSDENKLEIEAEGNFKSVESPFQKDSSPKLLRFDHPEDNDSEAPLSPVNNMTSDGPYFPTLLDSILGPNYNQNKIEEFSIENDRSSDFLPIVEKCNSVNYNLWQLGQFKVLIRCNYHGVVKDKEKARYVYLQPKMEYQLDSGVEQVTLNEMTRTWASCFIRPGTNLIRARINPFKSEIVMLEERPIEGILNSSMPFRPDHSFEVIRRIFEELSKLSEGQYVLTHPKGHRECRVRRFNGKASLLKEPKKKKNGVSRPGQVPWIPIDHTTLSPTHIHNFRIPGTFMPSDWTLHVNHGINQGGNGNQDCGLEKGGGMNDGHGGGRGRGGRNSSWNQGRGGVGGGRGRGRGGGRRGSHNHLNKPP